MVGTNILVSNFECVLLDRWHGDKKQPRETDVESNMPGNPRAKVCNMLGRPGSSQRSGAPAV